MSFCSISCAMYYTSYFGGLSMFLILSILSLIFYFGAVQRAQNMNSQNHIYLESPLLFFPNILMTNGFLLAQKKISKKKSHQTVGGTLFTLFLKIIICDVGVLSLFFNPI